MGGRVLRANQQKVSPNSSASGVEVSVQELIKQVTDAKSAALQTRTDSDKVILDVEVDGVRCLLVRSQPKSQKLQVMLSPREQEIARMVAKGYPNKIIADVLDISSWTVCTHLRRVFAKLGVGSR